MLCLPDEQLYSNRIFLGDTSTFSREFPALYFALASSIRRLKLGAATGLQLPRPQAHGPYEHITFQSRPPAGRHLEMTTTQDCTA
jgi:hypothetical protein